MKKTATLVILIVMLAMPPVAGAQEKKLGVTLDTTYVSKWMSRGRSVWGADGGFFESVDFDLWGSGFGAVFVHQSSTGDKWVNKQRLEYGLYYRNSIFDDSTIKTNYKLKWVYKNWYDNPRDKSNLQAWVLNLSWPDILAIENLNPYYTAYYDYPAGSNYDLTAHYAGWVHLFGLGYNMGVESLTNPVRLTADLAYTDGMRAADHDWSYATFGASTKLKLSDNLSFVPGIYHQLTMDKSVGRKKDITYTKLSMKYKF